MFGVNPLCHLNLGIHSAEHYFRLCLFVEHGIPRLDASVADTPREKAPNSQPWPTVLQREEGKDAEAASMEEDVTQGECQGGDIMSQGECQEDEATYLLSACSSSSAATKVSIPLYHWQNCAPHLRQSTSCMTCVVMTTSIHIEAGGYRVYFSYWVKGVISCQSRSFMSENVEQE